MMECDDFCLGIEVLKLIEEMQLDSARPDYVTFVNVLSGCSHTGLVGRGWEYIKLMSNKFGEAPRIEHHACMVDLLGEAGKLYEAKNLLNQLQLRMVYVCGAFCQVLQPMCERNEWNWPQRNNLRMCCCQAFIQLYEDWMAWNE